MRLEGANMPFGRQPFSQRPHQIRTHWDKGEIAGMVSALPSETASPETHRPSRSRTEADVLVVDALTFKDLEIFESPTGGTSLFEFCNLTRSEGGAKVLRRRMEHPWSDAARIRATQESLSFILAERQAFDKLPSLAYTTSRAEHYAQEILPLVAHDSLLEFSFGAFQLWINHERDYSRIVRGVQVTCRLIRALRRFVGQSELASPAGDLAPLVEEMRDLLARPELSRIPDQETAGWAAWRILRIDQVFRLHEKAAIARMLEITYEMDALVAIADVTRKHEFILPRIEEGPLRVNAEGLVHPLLRGAVANPVTLDQNRRVLFLTGPNMAGKTTYLRAFATALYLAHLGMGVPARSFRFVPAQRLFSSISLSDDLQRGVSYFRAEALRVKAIAQDVAEGYRVVALMDEPFKGTNVKDALDASLAILERFVAKEGCLFMFSSHLIELSERLSAIDQVDCRCFEADEGEGRLRFDYLLRPGVSSQRLGMRVLREEGIFELLDGAHRPSPQVE
jgi:DNA mismatch repair protein MutS